MSGTITGCKARSILDSRGKPTLEVILFSDDIEVSAFVPSGKSAGVHEALELRDRDGVGITTAIEKIETVIAPAIIGKTPDQKEIDTILLTLDGTENKTNLGGNSCIGISLATARLRARLNGIPTWKQIAEDTGSIPSFPRLYMNMINGGVHAGFRLPFQEYIVVIGKENPKASYEKGKEIFAKLGEMIHAEFGDVLMGDEGGYSPQVSDLKRPFEILSSLIEADSDIFLAIDAAASEFFKDGVYTLKEKTFSPDELLSFYKELVDLFPLRSIEDPFAEDEVASFTHIVSDLGDKALIVGDDLTVTNPKRVEMVIGAHAANAVIVKPNQIGTLSEVYDTVRKSREDGWKIIVSHRSGDTMGAFISDLAVGIGAYGIKAGSPIPPERRVKYERLVEIYEKEMQQ